MPLGKYCQICGAAKKASSIMAEAHGVVVNVDCLFDKVYGEKQASADEVRAMVHFCRGCGAEQTQPLPEHCPRCGTAVSPTVAVADLARAGRPARLEARARAFALDLGLVIEIAWAGVKGLTLLEQAIYRPETQNLAPWELWMISAGIVFILYHTIFTALLGRTPGKMARGLKVLLKDGKPRIGWFRSLLRSCLYFLTIYVFPLGLILLVITEPKDNWRRIIEEDSLFHNSLTDTTVVRPR